MKHSPPLLAVASLLVAMTACQPVEQTVAVTGVRVTPATLALTVGESAQLTATIEPKDATDQTITWSSSDDAIATVSDGKVTAIAEGSVTITAEAGGKKGTCSITVAPYVIPVTCISLDKESLELIEGETYTLTATLEPENATDKTVVWQSSDEGIATVEDGVVTAVGIGTATLTATAPSEGLSASCEVTVSRNMDRNIVFADKNLEAMLVAAFDTNGDGGLSYREAAEVTSLEGVFGNRKDFKSFDEFQYFTGVTRVEEYQFKDWAFTSIILPDTIDQIGYEAFWFCKNLKSITLPEGLFAISGNAFWGCSSLVSITFPESLRIIGGRAFNYCESLSSVDIPASVNKIGPGSFSRCPRLQEFKGTYASEDGRLLVKDGVLLAFAPAGLSRYSIPEGIATRIEEAAFDSCDQLWSLGIPEGIESIGEYAFLFCVFTNITLPESLVAIENGAFEDCDNMTSIHIPQNVKILASGSFSCCDNLKSFTGKYATEDGRLLVDNGRLLAIAPAGLTDIVIPEGITIIGHAAMMGCEALSSITLPESIQEIEAFAMSECYNMEYIVVNADTPPVGGQDMFYNTVYKNGDCSIYVPKYAESAYKQARYWSEYAYCINPPYSPAVDMGLSVKWATYNIGASSIIDYGDYYAWGELDTKWYYDGEHYLLGHMNDGVLNLDYYNYDDDWTRLKLYDDIAHQAWGGRWRMPTSDEYAELMDNCDWEWITINNIKGIHFTSRINGNSIFFPAGGLIEGTTEYDKGTMVNYWTSTKPAIDLYRAHSFGSLNGSIWIINKHRTLGMPVRAVKEW